jgi:hypothetical protein
MVFRILSAAKKNAFQGKILKHCIPFFEPGKTVDWSAMENPEVKFQSQNFWFAKI